MDPTKTLRSDAGSEDVFTYEIYRGGERILQASGKADGVKSLANAYASAGQLDHIHLYARGSTEPAIFTREDVLELW